MRKDTRDYLEDLVNDFVEDLSIDNLLFIHDNNQLDLDYRGARKFFIEFLAAKDKK
jgi:hypothetical protein